MSDNKTSALCLGRQEIALFLLVMAIGIVFAAWTHHAWEDWYITYRASKNLALGNGLVFNPGEYLHTFTSPLNALVPAALSYLTGNSNDDLVLWLYRIISLACLGTGAVFLLRIYRQRDTAPLFILFGLALLLVDAKTIDFTINGQETGFVLLFLLASLYVLTRPDRLSWQQLGLAWGGLMWSRPDGCIQIGATALAFLLFAPSATAASNRRELLRAYVRAGIVATLVYVPWLLWTTWYYGTPVPHTVVAKSVFVRPGLVHIMENLVVFPWLAWIAPALGGVFAPSDYLFGGWPASLINYCRAVEWICAFVWLLPYVKPLVRAFSFSFMLALFYLLVIAVPYAWYYPQATCLGAITLVLLLQQVLGYMSSLQLSARSVQIYQSALLAVLVSVHMTLFVLSAYQLRMHQVLIEDSVRRPIGEWLKENSRSGDTVFLECLGYIGFYSGMKTYDFPGMSSPEMVAARKAIGPVSNRRWDLLIRHLKPDWLVLRNPEAYQIHLDDEPLLREQYQLVRAYSSAEQIRQAGYIPGVNYLEYDSTFLIYRKRQ